MLSFALSRLKATRPPTQRDVDEFMRVADNSCDGTIQRHELYMVLKEHMIHE
jgi:hypothetical protein